MNSKPLACNRWGLFDGTFRSSGVSKTRLLRQYLSERATIFQEISFFCGVLKKSLSLHIPVAVTVL